MGTARLSILAALAVSCGGLVESNPAPEVPDACCATIPVTVVAGADHSCVLFDDGTVKCWGGNSHAQLGLGDAEDRGDEPGEMGEELPTVDLGTGRTVTALSAGGTHTCAILDDGALKCWGDNHFGELGLGDADHHGERPEQMGDALPAVDLGYGRTAQAVSANGNQTCALLDDDSVKCWGDNEYGQLGIGDSRNRGDEPGEMGDALPPVDLGPDLVAWEVVAGGRHECVRSDFGRIVECWGDNFNGELGVGDTLPRGDEPGEMGDALPVVGLGLSHAIESLACGTSHNCVRLDDGSVKCWGFNAYGQLGIGDTANRGDAPGELGGALPAVDLGAGRTATALVLGSDHACVIRDDAAVVCWGWNGAGQLGVGDHEDRYDPTAPVDLGTGRTARSLAAGFAHTCAILDDDSVKCWGRNYRGELGIGDAPNHYGDEPGEMGDALPTVQL
jgi:alpha-tubulin suppressor-like RCC1 family protein